MEFIAADGRRIGPSLAVDVHTSCVSSAAGSTAGRIDAEMKGAGEQRVSADVLDPAWQRCRATVIKGVIIVIAIGSARSRVKIDDAIVQRAPIRPATMAGSPVACECAVVQGAIIPILVCDCTILKTWQTRPCPNDFI